jgi:hypothetical protein
MAVDNQNHSKSDGAPELPRTSIPVGEEVHKLAEAQDSASQYVFDQLDLELRTNPESFAVRLSDYGPLWKLPRGPRQRIFNHFLRQILKPEPRVYAEPELTAEDRYQESLEDTGGFPSYEARAIARGEAMVIPTPRLHLRSVYREPPKPVDSVPDVFRRGPLNDAFLEAELGSITSEDTQVEDEKAPNVEVHAAENVEPIKFGIEPNGGVTHTRRERKSATKLQEEAFSKGGALKYLKFVSSFGDKTKEERIEVMAKSLNHMFDYEENARVTMESLQALIKLISENAGAEDELLCDRPFMKDPGPTIQRALEAVTYYREAINAMNTPKSSVKGTISERVESTVLNDTVDNVETTAAELYFREEERQKLWDIQLRGIPSTTGSRVPERFGAIDIVTDVPELASIVETRLLRGHRE